MLEGSPVFTYTVALGTRVDQGWLSACVKKGGRSRLGLTNNDFEIADTFSMSMQKYRSESGGVHDHRISQGMVVQYSDLDSRGEELREHEAAALAFSASRLAALKGYSYAGKYDPGRSYEGPVYFVPRDTLTGIETARKLGIRTEHSLFGGVVPYPFVATKTLTHPLVGPEAFAPVGWSVSFAERLQNSVLFGFSAFTRADMRSAGARVLERGPARLKPARGIGGRGQVVLTSESELETALDTLDAGELWRYGIVIEQNLNDVSTYSVGQVRVADLLATYCGTQQLTRDNHGAEVYGGSDLLIVRGDYEALLRLELPPPLRSAVGHARAYDEAAFQEFPALIASRRNYDVVLGLDEDGRQCSGVLEQSWRIGGATPAELAALEHFHADRTLGAVRARCTEAYGKIEPPPDACVHFCGSDDLVGPITKYTVVEAYGDAR
jgi:Protein of unknown function (DUF3182)